jgi:glycosyltransferase involved in cell wall biosynthesis
MLRSALQSVANQSRRDLIKEVIVSENSDDQMSKEIVNEFPELPVSYIVQFPVVNVGNHFALLVDKVQTDWVALLGDDDMWGRYHLEEAHRCLLQEPDSIAYVGWDAYFTDESRPVSGARFDPLGVLNSGENNKGYFKVDFVNMSLACLNLTPLNMWATIGKKNAVSFAFQVFKEKDLGADSDRYMFWLLSQVGPVLVGKEITLFYRLHGASNNVKMHKENSAFQVEMEVIYTTRMIEELNKRSIPIEKELYKRVAAMSRENRNILWTRSLHGSKIVLLKKWPKTARLLMNNLVKPVNLNACIHQLLPPLIISIYRRYFFSYRLRIHNLINSVSN